MSKRDGRREQQARAGKHDSLQDRFDAGVLYVLPGIMNERDNQQRRGNHGEPSPRLPLAG
jgi:hypothetical protein